MLGFDNTQEAEDSELDSTGPNDCPCEFGSRADIQPPAGKCSGKPDHFIKGIAARYLAAMVIVGLAYLLRETLVRRHGGYPPFITFYPAVLLVAVMGDMWAGILTTVLSGLIVAFCVYPPFGYFAFRNPVDAISLAIFCFSGILVSLVADLSHRSRERLAVYRLDEAVRRESAKAEEARRISEFAYAERQRLFDVLDTLPAIISLLTPDHRVVFSNRGFRETFGESNGKHCYEAHFGIDAPCESCETYVVLKTGQTRHWEHHSPNGDITDAYNCAFTDVDGSPLVLSMNFDITEKVRAEIELKKYRESLEALVKERTFQLEASNTRLLADIAEREKAEQALRESERRYSALFANKINAMAHCRIITDEHGKPVDYRILKVNEAYEQIIGIKKADIEGRRVIDVFPGVEKSEFDYIGVFGKVALEGGEVKVESAPFESTGQILSIYAYSAIPGEFTVIFTDVTQIKKAEETLRALTVRLQRVREEERATVARDLHDQLGQILTAIKMDVTWVARRLPGTKSEVRDRLTRTIQLITDGAQSVRRICSGLRPGVLDDLGLAAAIEWEANEFSSRTGICCNVSVPSEDLALNTDSVTAIFRVFQEALTNVARHADAHKVIAFLGKQDDSLVLVVEDDGNGFRESEATDSLGLLGMRERAQACGGDVQISSSPGNGTTVTMRTPLCTSARRRWSDHAHFDS
jgi:PAS domain S-box-containing protein